MVSIEQIKNTIICGKALETVQTFPDKSVNCVITSPPYWQLRDYKWEGQWGLEPTFEMYLDNLWSLMDEIFRVLTDDGTVWINIGDTYGSFRGKSGSKPDSMEREKGKTVANTKHVVNRPGKMRGQYDKCLLFIPHRFAIGCLDRGWVSRNDIIWAKRNSMPESVTDRFSKKHEYLFFFAKTKKYFFDLDAIREQHAASTIERTKFAWNGAGGRNLGSQPAPTGKTSERFAHDNGKNPGDVADFWEVTTKANKLSDNHYASYNEDLINKPIIAGCPKGGIVLDPFCGSGTTGKRARELHRHFIGIDGSEEFCKDARLAIAQANMFLNEDDHIDPEEVKNKIQQLTIEL